MGKRWWVIGLAVLLVLAGGVALALARPGKPEPATVDQAGPAPSPSTGVSVASSGAASPRPSEDASAPQRRGCAPHPSACGFPDATNTGVPPGTKLSVHEGNWKVTEAGTVIDGKDIRGCVEIAAPRVTIRRSRIACDDFFVVASFTETYQGGGALIQDAEIDCQASDATAIGSYGLTAVRVDVHGCENGFDIDNTMTVRDSFIHDPHSTAENHADGIQLTPGAHITIEHNTIFAARGTSAIHTPPSGNSDVLVAGNLMAGGAYTLYCPRDSSTDFRVIGNRFSTLVSDKGGAYGPWTDCAKVAAVNGNVWDETLKSLQDN